MASTAAIEGAARSSHYGASKGGVCAMVRALAVELARYKITVNSILPGWIETEMTANAVANPKFAGNVLPRIPERRWGTGADFGHIYDHHAVVYEFKDGAKIFSFCRQQDGCYNDVNDYIQGSKGRCNVMRHQITGATNWTYKRDGKEIDMYQSEHNELFASIRKGEPINDGEWMTRSTLVAILGRMATYTGKRITWNQATESTEALAPKVLDLNVNPLPTPPVAMPGRTPLV